MWRLLTYLLTPWCRVLLEKLTGLQLVKKFPAFHGTRRFITALTSVRQLSLSWASPIQSIYSHSTSWRSILILSTHLRLGLPSGLVSGVYLKYVYAVCPNAFKFCPRTGLSRQNTSFQLHYLSAIYSIEQLYLVEKSVILLSAVIPWKCLQGGGKSDL